MRVAIASDHAGFPLKEGIPVTVVGEVTEASGGVQYFEGGRAHPLVHPAVDPFWAAFGAAAAARESASRWRAA